MNLLTLQIRMYEWPKGHYIHAFFVEKWRPAYMKYNLFMSRFDRKHEYGIWLIRDLSFMDSMFDVVRTSG